MVISFRTLIRFFVALAAVYSVAVSSSQASPKGKHITIKVTSSPGGMVQAVSSPRPSILLEPPNDAWLREGTVLDTVEKGSNRFYAVVPCADYQIDSLFIDGKLSSFPVQNPMLKISQYRWPIWAFREIVSNHSIRVAFRPNSEISITATATAGGNISPGGVIVLPPHSQQEFISQALEGYSLAHVIVDGQTLDPTESYTFNNVTASHTIQAVFEINRK